MVVWWVVSNQRKLRHALCREVPKAVGRKYQIKNYSPHPQPAGKFFKFSFDEVALVANLGNGLSLFLFHFPQRIFIILYKPASILRVGTTEGSLKFLYCSTR